MRYAEIIVNTPLAAAVLSAHTFTYSIPPRLADLILPGQLVWVPFGTRRLQGIVVRLSDESPVEQTKEVEDIVEARPFLTPVQIDLARWIAATYFCSLNDALSLMLPSGIEQRRLILLSIDPAVPCDHLSPRQAELVELLTAAGETKIGQVPRELVSALPSLERRGIVVRRTTFLPPRAKPKRVEAVRLVSEQALSQLKRPDKYAALVEFLRREPNPVWISALYAATGCNRDDLKKLEAAGVIALEREEVWRDSLASRTFELAEPPVLTPEQERVWQEVYTSLNLAVDGAQLEQDTDTPLQSTHAEERGSLDGASAVPLQQPGDHRGGPGYAGPALQGPGDHKGRPYPNSATFLLHGVTGSGKTEIYMRALAEVLAHGRQGIVLVPEIALTPQTIRRFGARFPNRIAVLHSRLSDGERYDTWRRCRDGLVDVVIGPRSALFAPLPRLGLIVIDEEHEPSYKQDGYGPGYHARMVAIELARRTGATLILGSATPDVETYTRARRGEFKLIELPQRIMGHRQIIAAEAAELGVGEARLAVHALGASDSDARYLELPPVEIVDLRAELKAGNRSIFSRALQREMARVLAAREQVILFLNRRGTATFVLCRDCGYVAKCRRCDNPMTYHANSGQEDQLVCHHCDRRDRVPTRCPQCKGSRIRYFGTGTQKVEEEIQKLFPDARTLRWDLDVTRGKDSHEAILDQFVQHRADVLIGTQMIAKGLDLPLVTLVGVVSADTALNLPDFRAGERTFQLLTQVAGRAGRSILGGKVILQTYNPDHYAVQAASRHDYHAFYAQEIAFRREQRYPPYSRLIRLLYANTSEKSCRDESAALEQKLNERIAARGLPALDLIGPAPAFFHRVRGEYRYQILVRGPDPHALLQDMVLARGWRVDVDPVSVL